MSKLHQSSQEGLVLVGGGKKDAGPVLCVDEGPVGAAARRISVEATSLLGLIYTLQPEEKPLEMRRRMLLYVGR